MTNALRTAIADLATTFATAVTAAIRGANLEDILGLAGTEAPAPVRRGPGRPRKAQGRTGTGNPGKAAGSKGARAAGGGGQPDPLAVPATPKTAGKSARATTTAPAGRGTAAKKTTAKAATSKKDSGAGRLARRSPDQIAKALAKIVELVRSDTGGLRAEQIRERLGMASKEMPRVLKEGLAKKVLKSKGQKRSTTYTAA